VAGEPAFELPYHMHPNPAGVERMVEGILPAMHSFLEQLWAKPVPEPKE